MGSYRRATRRREGFSFLRMHARARITIGWATVDKKTEESDQATPWVTV